MPAPAPPPHPIDPRTGAIQLPSEIVHELFHLVREGLAPEARRRVRALTGANPRQAQAFVDRLLDRR